MKRPPLVHYCAKPRCAVHALCGAMDTIQFSFKLKEVTCKECLARLRKARKP